MRTVPAKPVMDGSKVKWTLEQIEQRNPGRVRIDWLRFTVPLDAVIKTDRQLLDLTVLDLMDRRGKQLVMQARNADADPYTSAHMVTLAGAQLMARLLGVLSVGLTEDKGMDYYAARTALMYEGAVVGWVLAGGKSTSQAGTVHVNLFGSALLHIPAQRLADVRGFIGESYGWITRADLALDVWSGHKIEDTQSAYLAGQFDVRGKRPNQSEAGSWTSGHSRTFYVGSRGTGKLFRAYEKGHELFGHESGDPWIRYEVEMRSNHRVIDLDVLTRPGDFFAGAYGFCASLLDALDVDAQACVIPTTPELADKTAEAAVERVARWLKRTAGPAIVAAFDLGGDLLADIVDSERHRLPRRLLGIDGATLRASFQKVADAFAPAPVPSFIGA